MDLCDGGAVLAFALDGVHGVTCSAVRQLRDEEAVSEAEAMERWLDDRGKSNFEKIFFCNCKRVVALACHSSSSTHHA
jgi:hypothetical protein